MTFSSIASAGYKQVDRWFKQATVLKATILENYHDCSLLPQIARSEFLDNGQQLLCGSWVGFGRVQDLDDFGYQTQNNEDPPASSGIGVTPDKMQICQDHKYVLKLSDQDRQQMCEMFPLWLSLNQEAIRRKISKQIDAYSIPVILASADRSNVGNHAGVLTHGHKLGGQGGSADNAPFSLMDSNGKQDPEALMDLIDNMLSVAGEAGWSCGQGEIAEPGESVSNPTIVAPRFLEKLFRKTIRTFEGACNCSESATFRTGKIGNLSGVDIILTNRMLPIPGDANNWMNQIMMVDPSKILHVFHILTNNVLPGLFEELYGLHYVYDTFVTQSLGVIVANTSISR